MKEKVKKVLVWIFEFVLFCGYFYVLFVNLVCGFGYGGISSRGREMLEEYVQGIYVYDDGRVKVEWKER